MMSSMLLRLNVALLNENQHKHLHEVVIIRPTLIPGLNRTLECVARAQSVRVIFARRVA